MADALSKVFAIAMTCEITRLGGPGRLLTVLALLSLVWGGQHELWAEPLIHEIHYHPPEVDRVEPVNEEFVEAVTLCR